MAEREKKQSKKQKIAEELGKPQEELLPKGRRASGRRMRLEANREIRWGKLDNTAHLFPIIAEEGMSNVYRISIYLNEEIQGVLLQEALNIVLPKFSVFNSRLRQGMFWYYFEENGKPAPKVTEENTYPCLYIDENKNRSYLFRVTYYKTRINLEVFHVLTDGTGGFYFLKELAYQYLRLSHPELREKYTDRLDSHTSLNTEDSYIQNYKRGKIFGGYKSGHAYLLKGAQFPMGKMGVLHGHMPIGEVKRAAGKYEASINEFLTAAFIWAVYQACLKGMPCKKHISAGVPVNLRPYYHSVTTKNFFVIVTAIFHPVKENQPFEDVIAEVKATLREQITKEHLDDVLSYNVVGERLMITRSIPLVFKKLGLKNIYKMHAKANTTTVTNMGKIEVAPEYKEYVDRFAILLSRSTGQNTKMTIFSYDDRLTATITSTLRDTKLQCAFFRFLVSEGISVTIESNGVYSE